MNSREEPVHFFAGHRSVSVIALGLNADLVQAELIEGDDTIDTVVARAPSVFDRTRVDPVSDRPQQSEHQLLEELRITVRDQIQEIPPKTLLNVLQGRSYVVVG